VDGIPALGALVDPVRRSAYEAVIAAARPVGRDDIAATLGIGRTLAAFHLDKLVAAGLLAVSFQRPPGRTGPGAGRPTKLYRRAEGDIAVSVPPRAYETVAHVLAEAAESVRADAAVVAAARRRGEALGATAGPDVLATLAEQGYEPRSDGSVIRLGNCPFRTLAAGFPPLICGMNLALIEALVEAAGWPCTAQLDPEATGCCVKIRVTGLFPADQRESDRS
jgi:predicted ArsR family transcriptional regulator